MSREVLAPPLQHMSNNRCYRVNQIHEDFGGNKWCSQQQSSSQQQQKGYVEQDLYTEEDYEEAEDDDCTIEELANSTYKLALHVPNAFYGGLIGFKGATKRRIETETQTEIYVPRSTEKSNNVIIKGKIRSNICAAKRKIRLLIDSLRKRMRPTHFLAIALNSGEIKEKYVELKQQILQAQMPGIDEALFVSENCIHLTLVTCVLLDDEERNKAVELLQSCRQYVTTHIPFSVKVQGLEIMNDDPSAARVLYGRVEVSIELQQFANKCRDCFLRNGLAATNDPWRDDVKLHMTVLNNRYRQRDNENSPNNFDARNIFKCFGDFDFGKTQCNEVLLCIMHSTQSKDEFYKTCGSLKF